MTSRILYFTLFVFVLLLLTDLYTYKGVRLLTADIAQPMRKTLRWSVFVPSILSVLACLFLVTKVESMEANNDFKPMYLVSGLVILFWLPKVVFNLFHLTDDIVHLFRWGIDKLVAVFKGDKSTTPNASEGLSRWEFLTKSGLVLGGVMLGATAYGLSWGRFRFRVLTERVRSSRLPKAFHGKRIVHISDAHLGSFPLDSKDEILKAIEMINNQKPDYIFFTGDLVNNYASEAEPWIELFSKMEAKEGKYSVLGNHDYGDYAMDGPSTKKEENMVRLKEIHEEMGFRLMLDENLKLQAGGEEIQLVGIENWGKGFQQYGDFGKAMEGADENMFKILLSHDPTHWEEQVLGKEKVDLTLSGHTHGMQMGIEIPSLGIKISPSRLRYKRWAGLYSENDQHLYVNRGFGYLGLPARIGMWPEITVLELEKA